MLGIGAEFAIFVHSFLAGVLAASVYLSLRVLRRLVPHALWALNLEDGVYWLGTALYLFAQILRTSDGAIRWYQILGIVSGAASMGGCTLLAGRVYRTVRGKLYKKTKKSLAECEKNV